MTDAELHQKTAGLLAGTLPEADAEQFRAALRDSEPLREQARRVALGFLLAERSEQADLLRRMDVWEQEIATETPTDTDTARLELLLNERQDELELLRNMDAWENDLNPPTSSDTSRKWLRWVVWPAALLLVALLWWWYSASHINPEPSPVMPPPNFPDTPIRQQEPPVQSAPVQPPSGKHLYVAMARSLYRQSAIATDNIRSSGADTLEPLRRAALAEYEKGHWQPAGRMLDALLPQLPESEKPAYLLLLGGAFFEQGDFRRAASVFSQKALQNHPEYGHDAQRYELLSRLADLPADEAAFRKLIRTIRLDPDNPNRDLVDKLKKTIPDL